MSQLSLSSAWSEIHSSKFKAGFFYFCVIIGFVAIVSRLSIGFSGDPVNVTYSAMMKQVYLSGGTTAQIEAKKSAFVGQTVEWRGVVVDAQKDGWSGYTISVGDETTAFTDIYLQGVSEPEALKYQPGDSISFAGTIDRFRDGRLTGYVYLTDVALK